MASIRAFLGELKQRNVIRVAGVYAVTSWAVFQVAVNLFPALRLPQWTVTLVAVLMLIGFPIAIIIAWAFEKGPEGLRRTEAAPGPKPRLNLLDWALLGGLVLVVGVTVAQMTGLVRVAGRPGLASPIQVGAAQTVKSIAVLPFASFDETKEAEFFADGLTEEVINSLANIPELKVAGRTSSFYFKNKNHDLREIGAKLGVAHVLEGSVRREGTRIRITAQLIKVSDGFHMWSNTYDREFTDVLAVQTEIANTVAGVLKSKLLTEATAGTRNPQAYQLILQARGRLRELGAENLLTARRLYEQAIKLDPNSAAAQAGFAHATMLLAQHHGAIDYATARTQSERAIARALALDPNNVDAHIASGFLNQVLYRRIGDLRFGRVADAAYKRALQIDPRNPDALTYYATFLDETGQAAQAEPLLKQALEVDPLNRVTLNALASVQESNGKLDESIQTYKSVINLYPDFVDPVEALGAMLALHGRFDEALPWLQRASRSKADPGGAMLLAHVYLNLGMTQEARQAVAGIRGDTSIGQLAIAIDRMISRDYAGVLAIAETTYARTKDPFWPTVVAMAATHTGDHRKVIEQVRLTQPELLGADPQIGSEWEMPLATLHALNGVGLKEQANKVAQAILTRAATKPGEPGRPGRRVIRALVHAELGEDSRAIGELRQAVKEGFRSLYDYEDFVHLSEKPGFKRLSGNPEFQAVLATIAAENAKQRDRVLAARGGARPAAAPAA